MRHFSVSVEPKPSEGKHWHTAIVSIFEGDRRIGSYERLHPGFAETTFYPFEQDGCWYALYSADYTCTRLMTLPECRDIGGEEPSPQGFCPVEFYVPRYRRITTEWQSNRSVSYVFDNSRARGTRPGSARPLYEPWRYAAVHEPWQFLQTAFVAGCHWGDDSTWKLEVLDLSRASEGILARQARFGHAELPGKGRLKDCIDFGCWEPERQRLRLTRQETRGLMTGELIDPYDL